MGRGTGAKKQIKRRSFYDKSGIVFPVRRIQRHLKCHHLVNHKSRVSTTGALYLAAVMEYLTAEILELSGMAAHHNKKKRISPRSIWLAIKSDDEFRQLLKGSIMPESGNLWGGASVSANTSSVTPAVTSNKAKIAAATSLIPKKLRGRGQLKKPTAMPAAGQSGSAVNDDNDEPAPGTVETLTHRTLVSGVQLSVLKADITSVEADCYVNPTSSSVGFGGQVGARLRAVGGAQLDAAMGEARHQSIPDCGAVATPAAGLLASHIIHCNSPSWSDSNAIQKLQDTVTNCLEEVSRLKLKSVAIPSIGSGGNQFPKHTAAQTILRAISSFYKNKPPGEIETERIIFVLYDQQSVRIFRTELARLIE